jgi:hypothetical protein
MAALSDPDRVNARARLRDLQSCRAMRTQLWTMRQLRSAALIVSLPAALVAGAGGALAIADGDEASKSPQQILDDVQRDLAKVKSFHFAGTQTASGATSKLSGDYSASGAASLTIEDGPMTVRMVVLRAAVYIKGNATYWKAVAGRKTGAAVAKKLAGKWVKETGSAVDAAKPLFEGLAPKRLATCMTVGRGTFALTGTKTVGDQQVVVIEGKGDQPGTTPGLIYVTATGPVLPLRMIQTGKRTPGGHLDKRCQERDDTSSAGDVTFSRFNKVPPIRAPHADITIPRSGTAAAR